VVVHGGGWVGKGQMEGSDGEGCGCTEVVILYWRVLRDTIVSGEELEGHLQVFEEVESGTEGWERCGSTNQVKLQVERFVDNAEMQKLVSPPEPRDGVQHCCRVCLGRNIKGGIMKM
jgi:hypothetical protein